MPLFECSRCKAVDNTAAGDYWSAIAENTPPLCVECETGTWHGLFPKKTADEGGLVKGTDGFLYEPKELAPGGYFHGKVEAA